MLKQRCRLNDRITRWQDDKLTGWPNDQMTKRPDDDRQDDRMTQKTQMTESFANNLLWGIFRFYTVQVLSKLFSIISFRWIKMISFKYKLTQALIVSSRCHCHCPIDYQWMVPVNACGWGCDQSCARYTRFCLLLPPVSLTVTLLAPGFLIESEVVSGSGFPGVF